MAWMTIHISWILSAVFTIHRPAIPSASWTIRTPRSFFASLCAAADSFVVCFATCLRRDAFRFVKVCCGARFNTWASTARAAAGVRVRVALTIAIALDRVIAPQRIAVWVAFRTLVRRRAVSMWALTVSGDRVRAAAISAAQDRSGSTGRPREST